MPTDTPSDLVKQLRSLSDQVMTTTALRNAAADLIEELNRKLGTAGQLFVARGQRIGQLERELAEASRRIEELEFGPWKVK